MRNAALLSVLVLLSAVWLASEAAGQTTTPADADDDQPAVVVGAAGPKPELILKQAAEYLAALPAVSCEVETTIRVPTAEKDNRIQFKTTARLERPNRLALISDDGPRAVAVVSDGKTLTQYIAALNHYWTGEAPADFSAFGASGAASLMMAAGVPASMIPSSADAVYASLMEGVTGAEYLGTEKVGEVLCHHCRFRQKEVSWEIWIDAGERPLPLKVVPDLSKQLAGIGGGEGKLEYVVSLTAWNTAPSFTDADFKFTPPASAVKIEPLFRATPRQAGAEAAPHPLLGEASPAFATVDPEGKAIDMKDHFGKDVVMLDFFATWCGPCMAAMPEVSGVAKKYADAGLVFYAVNVGEDAATVKEFLKTKGFGIPVAMDPSSEAAQLYHVTGIPQTVLVGKDGKVQVVHIGFGAGMGAELNHQVEALLAGKDLAADVLAKAREKRTAANEAGGMKQAWSVPGQWSGVAADGKSGMIVAAATSKTALCIDADGKSGREIAIAKGGIVRLANVAGDAAPELIVYQPLGAAVKAYDLDGKTLWEYPGGDGIDDVAVVDVNRDGLDELVVGFNGGTGLHVIDSRGMALWKSTDLKNVWHVTAGDFKDEQGIEIVSTSSLGEVHAFSTEGHKLTDIEVPLYANMVRIATLGNGSHVAVVCGASSGGEAMASVNYDGDKKWAMTLPPGPTNHVDDMAVASSRPWAAVAMRGGTIHIVDVEFGKVIAHVDEQGMRPQVAWLPREGKTPLLLVATGKDLNAFEVGGDGADANVESTVK